MPPIFHSALNWQEGRTVCGGAWLRDYNPRRFCISLDTGVAVLGR